jgi:Predicted nucleotide-binding protein containing TIR-like domain
MSASKNIFIASSQGSLPVALKIAKLLTLPGVNPRVWKDFFPPGYVTFEVLERQVKEISGAIIIAAPDDELQFNGSIARVPRPNVILELGFFAGILARHRIALCKFDEVQLPSDVAGVTYIGMQQYPSLDAIENYNLPNESVEKLQQWAVNLDITPNGLPLLQSVHGYTGRWDAKIVFEKWREINISGANFAEVNFTVDLYIDNKLATGHGIALGELHVRLDACNASYYISHRINKISCNSDGSIKFYSELYSRLKISQSGDSPHEEIFDQVHGPSRFLWELKPHDNDQQKLEGIYKIFMGDQVRSQGKISMTKE